MTTIQDHDAIISGASGAGIFLGSARAQAGWQTALIERDQLGGTCVNVRCITLTVFVLIGSTGL